jgi:mannosyltransferase OCH1-like enzyme
MMARKSIWIFFFVNLAIVIFLVHSVWTLLSLLVVDGSSDAISRAELPGPNSELPKGRKQLIPKIIHQTYVNQSIPWHWKEAQQSCLNYHEDYEYKVGDSRCIDVGKN